MADRSNRAQSGQGQPVISDETRVYRGSLTGQNRVNNYAGQSADADKALRYSDEIAAAVRRSEGYQDERIQTGRGGNTYTVPKQSTQAQRSGGSYGYRSNQNQTAGQQYNDARYYSGENPAVVRNSNQAARTTQYSSRQYSNRNVSYPYAQNSADQQRTAASGRGMRSDGMTMAQQASGRRNNELYRNQGRTPEEPEQYVPERRRRKKRHPFRNFVIFLLVLVLLVAGGTFLLVRAPAQYQDGYHTRKAGVYNILVCATDEDGTRTDTIMMLTLNRKEQTIALTSLPRDTIIESGDKLNSVYSSYGCGESGAVALVDQAEEILGFRADGYMIISYEVFKDAVDALGGVWFDVPVDMTVDYANNDEDDVFIPAGEQLLDGDTALRVCRFRGYMMGDLQRAYVQQSFIKALIKQCLAPRNWLKLPGVYRAASANLLTDLSGANVRYIGLWAILSYGNGLTQNTLPGETCTWYGADCFGLYGQSVVDLVNEVLNPFEEEITIDDVTTMTVSEGELRKSTATGIPFDASSYEY